MKSVTSKSIVSIDLIMDIFPFPNSCLKTDYKFYSDTKFSQGILESAHYIFRIIMITLYLTFCVGLIFNTHTVHFTEISLLRHLSHIYKRSVSVFIKPKSVAPYDTDMNYLPVLLKHY
jgi:hypothetical protein